MSHDYLVEDDADETGKIMFILPQFVSAQGYSCAKEWTETKTGYHCGCPRCLRKLGLALVFHVEDWNKTGDCQEQWRKLIVSARVARVASNLVVPGYEGSGDEDRRPPFLVAPGL